jgi:hypothetical protein
MLEDEVEDVEELKISKTVRMNVRNERAGIDV